MLFVSDEIRVAHGLPDNWQAWHIEALGDQGTHVKLKGGVYRHIKPRTKRPDYKKPEPHSEREIVITIAEYRAMFPKSP
jgi:hypothetical protein